MSRFFIDRPVFAWVIAILLMVGGGVSIKSLPVAQYPSIAPPTIAITATYPGASAKVLEDTVTQVIEQKLNGIDHLRYIQSASLSSGQVTITVTFNVGADPDIAQVQVQNKVAQAAALLPAEVQLQGLVVDKAVQNFLLVIGFVSEDGSLSAPTCATSPWARSKIRSAACRASAISRPSARNMPCASGSIPASSTSTSLPPAT